MFGKIEDFKNQLSDALQLIETQETRLKNMSDYLKEYDIVATNMKTSLKEMKEAIDDFGPTKANVEDFEKEVETQEARYLQLQELISDLGNTNKVVEGYVERYIPMQTQTMINDTCTSFLTKKDKKKLEDNTRSKIAHYREEMLADRPSDVESKLRRVVQDLARQARAQGRSVNENPGYLPQD